jgi:pantoate--beta-alanine ligase
VSTLVFDDPSAMLAFSRARRASGMTVAVVPTMGALHAGHTALIDAARRSAEVVIVTIFVNPLQFNQGADFDLYPRPIDGDLEVCRSLGVHAVYAPTAAVMYPPLFDTRVVPGALAARLEGPMRPGHFEGVTTVVVKLFNATEPDVAVFGQKDYQQLAIVRRMVADLDLAIEIVGVATVRESDGLALSSRNARLTSADRAAAVAIPTALQSAVELHAHGERDAAAVIEAARRVLSSEPRARVEYIEIVDAATLEPLAVLDREAVIVVAAWFGDVRLIDNSKIGVDVVEQT